MSQTGQQESSGKSSVAATRKISAKELLTDIRAGMEDKALMAKYRIPPARLPEIIDKLVAAGMLKRSEFGCQDSLPELRVVDQIEAGRTPRDSPFLDFIGHFIKKNSPGESQTDGTHTLKSLFEDCFALKQNKIAELASNCFQSGDLGGAERTIALFKDRFPDSRRLKSMYTQLESAYEIEASRLLDTSWKRGGPSECQQVADSLSKEFPDSPVTRHFADQFYDKIYETSEECIEEHMERNDPETAYQILMKMKQQLSDGSDASEALAEAMEDLIPRVRAVRSYKKRLAALTPPTNDDLRRVFPGIPLDRIGNRELKFLKSPIEAFHDYYPTVSLHPAVERIVRVICLQFYEIKLSVRALDMFQVPKVLAKVAVNAARFTGLTDLEATRLWNMLTLVQMQEEGVKTYYITGPDDDISCAVCQRLLGQNLTIKDVQSSLGRLIGARHGEYFPEGQFPTFLDLDNMSPERRTEYLTKKGLIVPPFCHNCRCWIVPVT